MLSAAADSATANRPAESKHAALILLLTLAPALHAANHRLLAYYYYGDSTNTIPEN